MSTKNKIFELGRMVISINVSSELWYLIIEGGRRETHLFFIGWYSQPKRKRKLFAFDFLFLSIHFGIKERTEVE